MKLNLLFIVLTVLSLNLQAGSSEPSGANKTRAICGKLADSNGEAIVGAAIKIVETGEVIYTDLSGRYSLSLPAGQNSTLQLQSVGYLPLVIKSSGLSNFDVLVLKEL